MKRHEECTEGTPGNDGNERPEEIATERVADHTCCKSREIRATRKPDRPQMPYLAVALRERNIIDRAPLDEDRLLHRGSLRVSTRTIYTFCDIQESFKDASVPYPE